MFRGLSFTFVYVDDVVIASQYIKEHIDHVEEVFKGLNHYRLKINIAKCEFVVPKLTFLGHVIDGTVITLIRSKP